MSAADEAGLGYDLYRRVRTFGSLDGLRCLSIVAVIWSHAGGRQEGLLGSLLARGGFGVDLFFIISGFLITTLLLRERESTGMVSLRKFYIRRALRIFPLYYATLLLYVVMIAAGDRGRPADFKFWEDLPYFATYTFNVKDPYFVEHGIFGHSWSLATEEQFYLVWPLLFVLAPRLVQVLALCAVIGLDVAYSFPAAVPPLAEQALPTRILAALSTPICLGVLLALGLHDRRSFGLLARVLSWRWAGVMCLALMLAALAVWERVGLAYSTPMAWIAATGLVGACVIREDHAMRGAMSWRPIAWVGVVSYGLYLLHPLALGVAQRALVRAGMEGKPGVALFVATCGVAAVMAAASYSMFERRFLRLKARFASGEGHGRAGGV